ncbi:MAG: PQQ-dependent sugar dehydrogenase [Bacteroidia bacterium]|nr:PQQ-dependent sugar dehydrogenase [Bacteroidia bacterium]
MKSALPLLFLLLGLPCAAQPVLQLVPLASGFSQPVDIASAGDGRLFIVERSGSIQIIRPDGSRAPAPFLNIISRVRSGGQEQGLLGLAFHPSYAQNGYFYVYYTNRTNGQDSSRISRFQVQTGNPDLADPASEQILLKFRQPFANHNAGDLAFGPDGYLYIASGDGGSGGDPDNHGQRLNTLLGKILRIDVNSGTPYAIPADNPFIGTPSARPEIWSLGWRNPWRFSFDRGTGDMWIADVGQDDVEEISREAAGSPGGRNYGWKCYEGNSTFSVSNCTPGAQYSSPVYSYQHSFSVGSSITGGFVYRGTAHPGLQGSYIFGDYNSGNFWLLTRNAQGTWLPDPQGALLTRDELSTFGEDQNGELYAASLGQGIIYRVGDALTSADPDASSGLLRVRPQPASGLARMFFPNPGNQTGILQVFDLSGRLVQELAGISGEQAELDASALTPGIYLLDLRLSGGQRFRGRLMRTE